MNLYALHGILQIVAFAILFPLGILVAVFRDLVGERWFSLHIGIQTTAIVTVFVALVIAAIANYNKDNNKDNEKKDKNDTTPIPTHVIVDSIVVVIILCQLVWAIYLRHIVPRPMWLVMHIILATGIILAGWTNLYLGYNHYKLISS
jgi:uncharacterized membrane protein YbjE (DUF340 family)